MTFQLEDFAAETLLLCKVGAGACREPVVDPETIWIDGRDAVLNCTCDVLQAEDTSRGIPTDLRGNLFDSGGATVFRGLRHQPPCADSLDRRAVPG